MDIETGSERELLEGHLDGMRATAVRKVQDLTWTDATRRLGPSVTSAAGIIKHLTEVERWWYRHHLAGEDAVPFWSTDENPDCEFDLAPSDDLASLISDYQAACSESRAIAEQHSLDDRCVRAHRNGLRPSLRWVYIHTIEEIARHNGHLDIYRELIDGTTGRWLDESRMP
ncbi:MAG: DinB family protein [Actinomycetota bacterium]|nr:DinB family protein [Actinomycetota bacterium]